jgi:hypothetical protein
LRLLRLRGTKVTQSGLKDLEQALPYTGIEPP